MCWDIATSREILEDVQNSVDCDSMYDGLRIELALIDSVVVYQKAQIYEQEIMIKLLREACSVADARVTICKVDAAQEAEKAAKKIWILKVERIIYPIATAVVLILMNQLK
jgi:hypothetical protein